jgi:hypothetical protein
MIILAHAVVGVAVLLLGLTALTARKRRGRHTRAGTIYVWIMLPLLVSGLVIGARHPGISPFEAAVIPTGGPLLLGYWAVRWRPRRFLGQPWLTWHVSGMGGSFIGVVTAGGFQVFYPLLPDHPATMSLMFAVPTVAGSVLIARTIARRTAPPKPAAASTAVIAGWDGRR